jgi:molybdopterin/thiamine biosynthesis adenylyltransferase
MSLVNPSSTNTGNSTHLPLERTVMENKILFDLLQSYAEQRTRPDKSLYKALLFGDACEIAEKIRLPLATIECAALEAGIVPERYSRNQKSLSNPDQLRLLRSHVAIIGLGGLGGTVTEILARIGIGRLTLVDGDCFDESNLNRQLLSSPANVGQSKAETAKLRVQEINPAVKVRTIPEFFRADNAQAILHGAQLAIDCLDTIADRFILEEGCRKASIPLISAAIAGSSGQATVIFPEDPGLKEIYGQPGSAPKRGIEASVGTLPFGAVYMAAVECSEAATILLGRPSELRNKLFMAEVSDHTTELFSLPGLTEESAD